MKEKMLRPRRLVFANIWPRAEPALVWLFMPDYDCLHCTLQASRTRRDTQRGNSGVGAAGLKMVAWGGWSFSPQRTRAGVWPHFDLLVTLLVGKPASAKEP
jgi:hypothetical protein